MEKIEVIINILILGLITGLYFFVNSKRCKCASSHDTKQPEKMIKSSSMKDRKYAILLNYAPITPSFDMSQGMIITVTDNKGVTYLINSVDNKITINGTEVPLAFYNGKRAGGFDAWVFNYQDNHYTIQQI